MKRKIEFVKHPHALSVCKSSVIVGIAVLLVLQFVFSLEQSAFTYGGVIVGAIFQYIAIMRKTESNLTVDTTDVYLFGIPAALRCQKSILGKPYIRVTSLTRHGYHRVKVYEDWVTECDWQFMLTKCS